MNKRTLSGTYTRRIGRADIEESNSRVDRDSHLLQASYPCGNFSDTRWEGIRKATLRIWISGSRVSPMKLVFMIGSFTCALRPCITRPEIVDPKIHEVKDANF